MNLYGFAEIRQSYCNLVVVKKVLNILLNASGLG